jgi:hypothetical protein
VRVNVFVGLACASLLWASVGEAQSATPPAESSDRQLRARHQITILEGVFEDAVQYSARMLNRRLQTAASAPDMVLLSGAASARGFRLEGYGVFFDVEFPALRRSIIWSFRTLDRPDPVVVSTIQDLRATLQTVTDPETRQMLERTLKRLEARNRLSAPPNVGAGTVSAASSTVTQPAQAPARGAVMDDPGAVYLAEVKSALISAMLEHAGPIELGPDEWLTVAARESGDHSIVPADAGEGATTIVLRLKGSDLAALRSGRLSADEVRTRVDAREY